MKGAAKDKGGGKGKKGDVDPKTGRNGTGRFRGCAICGKLDHWAKECPKKDAQPPRGSKGGREAKGES